MLPSMALALAGIAESSSSFHYNDFAQIERGHPSDLCSGGGEWGKWCLAFRKERFASFKSLDSTFTQVSVPSDHATPYFIGQSALDDRWVIYDLQQEVFIVRDADYPSAISSWRTLGLVEPSFVNARNTREMLIETDDSVASRWSIQLQMWFFMGVIPLTPIVLIFWYLSKKSMQQHKKSGSIIFGAFSYLFVVPIVLIVYIALSSLSELIYHNW